MNQTIDTTFANVPALVEAWADVQSAFAVLQKNVATDTGPCVCEHVTVLRTLVKAIDRRDKALVLVAEAIMELTDLPAGEDIHVNANLLRGVRLAYAFLDSRYDEVAQIAPSINL